MNPAFPRSEHAPILEYGVYTGILANNGSEDHDFVRARGENWVVLEPEHLLAGLVGRFPNITRLYGLSLPSGRTDRYTKFRTIMAILNITARKVATSMTRAEFVEIVLKSMPAGGTNPFHGYELMSV